MAGDPEDRFVMDSSITMAWVFEDEHDPYALSVRDALPDYTPVVPSLFLWEVSNVLRTGVRRGRITDEKARAFIEQLHQTQFEVVSPAHFGDMKTVLDFALSMGLTAYDAQYVLLAQERNLPLASLDKEIQAAIKSLGIQRFEL
jgi:predicted nucleic acid-binding protein